MSTNQPRRSSTTFEERPPVGDAVMAALYRADLSEIDGIVDGFPGEVRARLAAFCYSRAHLRAIGRVVAARCDDMALLRAVGGAVGACLIDSKRNTKRDESDALATRSKARVTLATAADMRRREPIVDEMDFDETA